MKPSLQVVGALALTGLATVSLPAHAWDWGTEKLTRQWRQATIDWAQEIAQTQLGQTYSDSEIVQGFAPPPREDWCIEAPNPTQLDCQVLNSRINNWLHDFLAIPAQQSLPPSLPAWPAECSSICSS